MHRAQSPGRRRPSLPQVLVSVCLLAVFAMGGVAGAQSPAVGQMIGPSAEDPPAGTEGEELRESLDNVIATLEDAERRGEMLDTLRELRAALEAGGAESPESGGLLGALSEAFDQVGRADDGRETALDTWRERAGMALEDATSLAEEAEYSELLLLVVDGGTLFGLWVVVIAGAAFLVRRLRSAWGLSRLLPGDPPAWLLAVHFVGRILPWALGFGVLFGVLQLVVLSPGRVAVVIIAYAALCGRILAAIAELVIALFTLGHRRVGASILRRHAPPRLFVIGAMIGLADAMGSAEVEAMLGADLADLLALSLGALAIILSVGFILRFRRSVQHLVYNRPYHQRRNNSATNEILRFIARFWHIPALLLAAISLMAVVVTEGEPGDALLRGVISVALLAVILVVTRLINHYREQPPLRPRRMRIHQERLEQFGYTVAQLASWTVFAELTLWVWGGSLFGFGQETFSARIAQAALAVAVTGMLAWLAWILADSAIQRGLASTVEGRGRRVNAARVQTITPMIRNVLFTTILVIASIVALANLGVNVTPLLAGAGIIGIAIGFGAQTLVQDLITGMFILIEDSLAIDDFVDVGGQMGTVEGLSLRTVRLRDLDGILHIIPFSQIKAIHNMSRQFGVALIRIQVPHTMPVDDAQSILREVSEELRKDPVVGRHVRGPLELQGVERFEEGAAVLRVRMRTAPVMQWEVARDFNLRLKRRLEQEGLDLATQRISLRMEEGRAVGEQECAPGESGEAGQQPEAGR